MSHSFTRVRADFNASATVWSCRGRAVPWLAFGDEYWNLFLFGLQTKTSLMELDSVSLRFAKKLGSNVEILHTRRDG